MWKTYGLLVGLVLAEASPAGAQQFVLPCTEVLTTRGGVTTKSCVPVSQATPLPMTQGGPGYTLLANSSVTGQSASITAVPRGLYVESCVASAWNGASAQLQALALDGSTWLSGNVAALTANSTQQVQVGQNSTLSVLVSGGPPTGLYCGLN